MDYTSIELQNKTCLQPDADPDLDNSIFTVETCSLQDDVCTKTRCKNILRFFLFFLLFLG